MQLKDRDLGRLRLRKSAEVISSSSLLNAIDAPRGNITKRYLTSLHSLVPRRPVTGR
jgi:hypothetical protein